MPYTEQGLPFQSGAGSHTSWKAAKTAAPDRRLKTRRYLQLLAARGPLIDHAAAAVLGCPLSSVCSIRNGCMTHGLVRRGSAQQTSPYGQAAWTWELTEAGAAAVTLMTEPG